MHNNIRKKYVRLYFYKKKLFYFGVSSLGEKKKKEKSSNSKYGFKAINNDN